MSETKKFTARETAAYGLGAVGKDMLSRRALNGRAYLSDPDVFFLRTENCKLTKEQKMMLAKTGALLGDVWLTSDDPSSYTEEMKQEYHEFANTPDQKITLLVNDATSGSQISRMVYPDDFQDWLQTSASPKAN